METSPLICGFYMITASVMKELDIFENFEILKFPKMHCGNLSQIAVYDY